MPKGNLKWLPVTSIAGTADQLAAAELSFQQNRPKANSYAGLATLPCSLMASTKLGAIQLASA